jgi:anti-sigma B factor antagonist
MAVGRAAAMEMRVRTEEVGEGVHVVSVTGEVDLYAAPELLKTLRQLAESSAQQLVVDVSATSFIDSTGLGILIAATKVLRLQGGELHIVGTHGLTDRAVRAAGLHTFFALSPSVEDALGKI